MVERPEVLHRSPKIYSLSEYLKKEAQSQHKHEFHNGHLYRMPGSKANHNIIAANFTVQLGVAAEVHNKPFTIMSSDQKIYIASIQKVLYADVLVVFEALEFWEGREDLLVNPILIVEVASNSTRDYDRGEKFMYYRLLDSFKEYILIEQDSAKVESFFRERKNTWDIVTETDLNGSIELRSLGISIPLNKIYKNVGWR
jgi:Uma2 family endonuclease